MYEHYIVQANKIINRFVLKSKSFCDTACGNDGLHDILMFYSENSSIPSDVMYSPKLSYDYDYFAFTKCTKSLLAIRTLLNDQEYHFNEDVMMQIRSIFEAHIMTRYVREHIDIENEREKIIKDFIINPLAVTLDYFSLQGNTVLDVNGNNAGKITMPANYKMGEDVKYYSKLYQFLCQYTHCSFGAIICYFGKDLFMYYKENFSLLVRLLVVFVFTKLYEGIVTVNGEDLGSKASQKAYYDLAYDSLEFQYECIEFLSDYYDNKSEDNIHKVLEKYIGNGTYDNVNSGIVDLLNLLKDSLFDEIGSLHKEYDGVIKKFNRKYQER